MTNTWKYDLLELLEQARKGKRAKLEKFIEAFSPFAAVNKDYSALVVLRHFDVSFWEGERSVLNGPPEGKDFQWGITIATQDNDGGMESNVYMPNSINYSGLKIEGNEIEILTGKNTATKTNITELYRKLDFWDKFSEKDIENEFNTLCNEDYERKETSKPKIKHTTIQIHSLGELKYDKKHERYEGTFKIDDHSINFSVAHAVPKKLEKLISFVDNQVKSKFFQSILLKIEDEMIKLKNEDWLSEDDESDKEELPITPEEFRKRISISSIDFYDDYSSTIYCDDGDIFWGHIIEINVDKKGKYQDVNLAG